MSLGQTMLTAGFVVLLIMLTISSNRMLMESREVAYESESIDIAADLANSLLIEATRKRFDENTYAGSLTVLTSSSNLGPESGEAITTSPDVAPFQSALKFDDVDDYNGYSRRVDGQTITGFIVSVKVYYLVSRTNLTKTTNKTLLKRLDVTTTHPTYMPSGFTITRILTY